MIRIRRAAHRGRTKLDWLDSRHSFSFGDYSDPEHMGFGVLRVLNDDRVAPGTGFGLHPHRDMEILTWVVSGALEHRDDAGGGGVLRAGGLQQMTAGCGIRHSEWNHSEEEGVRFLQIWIEPRRKGLEPGYAQCVFEPGDLDGRLQLIASPDGESASLTIQQDVRVHAGRFARGAGDSLDLGRGRRAWAQIVSGRVRHNGLTLSEGDGACVTEEEGFAFEVAEDAELLLFDLFDTEI